MSNARITALPWISGLMALDWPVSPITSPRTAERMRSSLAGIVVHLSAGRYVVARKVSAKSLQVWGANGTYAMGAIRP